MKRNAFGVLVAVTVSLLTCKSRKESSGERGQPPTAVASEPADASADRIVQRQFGGEPDEQRTDVGFEILDVYESPRPTDIAPFRDNGGSWTFFYGRVGDAQFSFGFESQPLEGVPFERATARLAVASRESARGLVTSLGAAFHVPPPAIESGTTEPRAPLQMAGVVVGRGLTGNHDGSYSSGGGDWVACKWTIERDEDTVEFFLNFNLTTKRGVFAEKDAEYRQGLINWLSASL